VIFAFACLASNADAKLFRNAYVSFELPGKWDCALENTEWVCRSAVADQAKESIIILTAKEVGPSDSIDAYEAHLKNPKSIPTKGGPVVQSQVVQMRNRSINNHTWVDGMHLSSEVQNYYTRYLATTKDRIAILVTFSAHKLYYTKYSNDFFNAILSLRVVADSRMLTNPQGPGVRPGGSELLGPGQMPGMPSDLMTDEALPEEGSGDSDMATKAILALVLIGAVLGLLIARRRKNKK
jgi:hypothetical protein